MPEPIEPKKTKPRQKRRNFAKDMERLTFYLETIIRVKDDAAEVLTDHVKGELKAYRDIQGYLGLEVK